MSKIGGKPSRRCRSGRLNTYQSLGPGFVESVELTLYGVESFKAIENKRVPKSYYPPIHPTVNSLTHYEPIDLFTRLSSCCFCRFVVQIRRTTQQYRYLFTYPASNAGRKTTRYYQPNYIHSQLIHQRGVFEIGQSESTAKTAGHSPITRILGRIQLFDVTARTSGTGDTQYHGTFRHAQGLNVPGPPTQVPWAVGCQGQ